MKLVNAATTIDDLFEDPKSYGLPSLAEFAQSKMRKDMQARTASFDSIDNGPRMIREMLNRVKFKINGVELANIEAAEKAIGDHGYKISDLEWGKDGRMSRLRYELNMIPQGAGKYDVEVNILP